MSLPLILRSGAEQDTREAAVSFEAIQPELGKDFLRRVRDVFDRLESQPEIAGFVWQDVRGVLVRRFRYVIYHITFADRIEVIAVLHGMRDAEAWRSRL